MILWKSKVVSEAEAEFPEVGRRSFRRILEVRWGFIELRNEVKFRNFSRKWRTGGWHINAVVNKNFCLGSQHIYYDGPNCAFSLGWLHFNWKFASCKKCESEA